MKVLIAEDERPASERLKKALREVAPDVEVIAITTSIESTLKYLRSNELPDILFLDIELSDGRSFSIFKQMRIACPVIFTTAYDEYWQEAFEHNSIDYLLKPIEKDRLLSALVKYRQVRGFYQNNYEKISRGSEDPGNQRLILKKGSEFVSLAISDIAYFIASQKMVFVVCLDGRKFLVPHSLAELESRLDSRKFRRVNRKVIVGQQCIRKITTFPKSRLLLHIEPTPNARVIVANENSSRFMQWMQGS